MKTSIYEADPFSGSKGALYLVIDTDYRFEKNDEVWIEAKGARTKVRITWVHVTVRENGDMERELLAMKL